MQTDYFGEFSTDFFGEFSTDGDIFILWLHAKYITHATATPIGIPINAPTNGYAIRHRKHETAANVFPETDLSNLIPALVPKI
jgi:hypothetical protein